MKGYEFNDGSHKQPWDKYGPGYTWEASFFEGRAWLTIRNPDDKIIWEEDWEVGYGVPLDEMAEDAGYGSSWDSLTDEEQDRVWWSWFHSEVEEVLYSADLVEAVERAEEEIKGDHWWK